MMDWDFRPVLWACFILGAIIIAALWGINTLFFASDEIKSSVRLSPIRTELVIVDNRVDTLYIYKKP